MPDTTPTSSSESSAASSPRTSTSSPHPGPSTAVFIQGRSGRASPDAVNEVARDPFRTPEGSVPPTPKPSSVVSFSGFADQPPFRRHDSRVSVHSALRNAVPVDGQGESSATEKDWSTPSSSTRRFSTMPPRPLRPSMISRSKEVSRLSTMTQVMKKRMRSSMLTGEVDKPWRTKKDSRQTLSNVLVYLVALLGIAGGAIRCYFTWKTTLKLPPLCLVMEDNFDTFDTENTWTREVSMSGFG